MNGLIQATQESVKALDSNIDSLEFSNVTLRTNSANCYNGWLNYNEGSASFNIVTGGIYEITFNSNVTSATAGKVGLALFANGNQLSGTEVDKNIVTANEWSNVAFNKKIRVCGRCNASATLEIRSVPAIVINGTSTATQIPIVKNANISIERLA